MISEINFEQFSNLEIIARGGFSKIYKANSRNYGKVALKKIKIQSFEDLPTKFLSEINILSKLNHPNIVCFYGITKNINKYYLVLELAETNLTSFLHLNQSLNWKERIKLSIDICRGLSSLHQNNIIHRDLKSENILIFKNNIIKITDFGISYLKNNLNEMTPTDIKNCFTPKCFSPEKFNPSYRTNLKEDIFSLGIIFWEISSLEKPYKEFEDLSQIISFILQGNRLKIPELIPEFYLDLIIKCWDQLPESRPNINYILEELIKNENNIEIFIDKIYNYYCNNISIKGNNEKYFNNLKIISYLLNNSDSKNDKIQYLLGYLYKFGIGVEKNYLKAFNFFQKSDLQNNSFASNNLGNMFKKGLGIEKNEEKSFKYFEKSANLNNSMGQYNLGLIYYHGNSYKSKNIRLSYELFQKSALNNNNLAIEFLKNYKFS